VSRTAPSARQGVRAPRPRHGPRARAWHHHVLQFAKLIIELTGSTARRRPASSAAASSTTAARARCWGGSPRSRSSRVCAARSNSSGRGSSRAETARRAVEAFRTYERGHCAPLAQNVAAGSVLLSVSVTASPCGTMSRPGDALTIARLPASATTTSAPASLNHPLSAPASSTMACVAFLAFLAGATG
jgi:hypothetical protein